MGGKDQVPVAVQEAVQLAQAGGPVTPKDREAGGPEASTRDRLCSLDGGGHGAAVDVRRASTVAPRDDGVQLVAQLPEGVDERSALEAQVEQLGVEAPEPAHEGVPLDLALDTDVHRET